MINKDKFPAIFFLFFSLYICYASLHLGIGNWQMPGAGFLSFWSGVTLGILDLVVLFQSWKLKANDRESWASWKGRVLYFFALLVFILLLDTLGFILTTFLFIGFLSKVVERKSWTTASLVALAVALSSYGLFRFCLQAELPKGILEIFGF